MKCSHVLLALGAILFICVARAEEVQLTSRIVSLGLFKNGLAVIKREVKLPGAGTFVINDVPQPVHGTWSVDSETPVEVRVTERETTDTLHRGAALDFQKALEGSNVTIHFRDGHMPPAVGRIERIEASHGEDAWNRIYPRAQPNYYYGWYDYNNGQPVSGAERFLILATENNGRLFVDNSTIASIESVGQNPVKARRPVLLLTVTQADAKPFTATIGYLARGIAWAPSYRMDISDPKVMTVEQDAAIRNELESFENAAVELISGFPSMQFSNVVSPLSPRTTWSSFFGEISRPQSSSTLLDNAGIGQQAAAYNRVPEGGGNIGAIPEGEGPDVHYQPIGARTMAEGDAMALTVAKEKTGYERIVEWIVPDTRDENGNLVQEWNRQQNPDKFDAAAWDALRFKNPFKFPMTTGPAAIIANGRFNGQRMSNWVNSGEDACIQVTKALSVRTYNSEHEEPGARVQVWFGNRQHQKAVVTGELRINNHRNEEIKVSIRRKFSGELIKADENPAATLDESGVYSINRRNSLVWNISLKPGEEKKLTYQYSVITQ